MFSRDRRVDGVIAIQHGEEHAHLVVRQTAFDEDLLQAGAAPVTDIGQRLLDGLAAILPEGRLVALEQCMVFLRVVSPQCAVVQPSFEFTQSRRFRGRQVERRLRGERVVAV